MCLVNQHDISGKKRWLFTKGKYKTPDTVHKTTVTCVKGYHIAFNCSPILLKIRQSRKRFCSMGKGIPDCEFHWLWRNILFPSATWYWWEQIPLVGSELMLNRHYHVILPQCYEQAGFWKGDEVLLKVLPRRALTRLATDCSCSSSHFFCSALTKCFIFCWLWQFLQPPMAEHSAQLFLPSGEQLRETGR